MRDNTRVLVIDDEFSILNALKLILEDNGYGVVTASTGREGIKHFQEQHFNITITDYCLPDMTGLDVIHQICQIQPGCSVILITAYASPETILETVKCGSTGFLIKPFEPSNIINLIEETLQS